MSATNVLRQGVRLMTTSATRQSSAVASRGVYPNTAKYQRVKEMQDVMCRDDGLMVWQKRGIRDTMPYQITMGIVVVGCGMVGYLLYRMAFNLKDKK